MNVSVGLMERRQAVDVELMGSFTDSNGKVYSAGRYPFSSEVTLTPSDVSSSSFALDDVTIGIGFHWERNERQVFRGALRIIQLVAVIFLTVSGGPYGIEPLLTYAGHNGALLLLMITPFLWDIPTIFTVLELNGMMPVTGGYYQWVKKALGLRFALYEGWWTWLYTFVDLAIYPVLFVEYASFFFPQIAAYKIPVCLVIIWGGAALNILGILKVGKASMILGIAVLTPFLILFITACTSSNVHLTFPQLSLQGIPFPSLGLALYTVMWNFIGWDNIMTYAEEVDKPVRSYMVASGIVFLLIFCVYFIAIFTAQASGIDLAVLNDQGFPAVGAIVGGPWLGAGSGSRRTCW